ncbi:O-antigen ligase [Marinoscillum sp. MHG1-6]|uniref:O-antigen ligase family protein n=1 Tax=Marinoscillum sp. MHG1-6 TaxID=2959627 RepID=UPI0021579B89|nr:O-antigen ligase family protein [Marinoscillum sp. MHG1-6]
MPKKAIDTYFIFPLLFAVVFIDAKFMGYDLYLWLMPVFVIVAFDNLDKFRLAFDQTKSFLLVILALIGSELVNNGSINHIASILGFVIRYVDLLLLVCVLNKYYRVGELDKLWVRMTLALIFIGLFGLALYFVGLKTSLVAPGHREGLIPSMRSLTFEPNFLAQICLMTLFLNNLTKGEKSILLSGLILTFTRSAILLFIVGKLFTFFQVWVIEKARMSYLNLMVAFLAIASSIGLFVLSYKFLYSFLEELFNNASAFGRFYAYTIAFEGFIESPIFGKGIFSADTLFSTQFGNSHHIFGAEGWLGSGIAQVAHDLGIVGLLALGNFYYRVYRKINSKYEKIGFVLLVTASMLASYNMTEFFIYGYMSFVIASGIENS